MAARHGVDDLVDELHHLSQLYGNRGPTAELRRIQRVLEDIAQELRTTGSD